MMQASRSIKKFMNSVVELHIQSSPSFTIELIVEIIIFISYVILIWEVNEIILKYTVNHDIVKKTAAIIEEEDDLPLIARNHPDLDVNVIMDKNSMLRGEYDTITKINKILARSLSDLLRYDPLKFKEEVDMIFEKTESELQPIIQRYDSEIEPHLLSIKQDKDNYLIWSAPDAL